MTQRVRFSTKLADREEHRRRIRGIGGNLIPYDISQDIDDLTLAMTLALFWDPVDTPQQFVENTAAFSNR